LSELERDEAEAIGRLQTLQDRVARAAKRSGRAPESVTLIAVSKRQPAEAVRELTRLGVRDFGENYVQEALTKSEELRDIASEIRWHLIGGLQKNKAGKAVALFETIQSIDSESLGEAVARRAEEIGKTQRVLVEVNLSGEAHRTGAAPDDALRLCEKLAAKESLSLEGLMGVAPLGNGPDDAQRAFEKLRALFELLPSENRRTLSMGMSGDFEVAIEHGATQIRIGTALFGARTGKG
jgi:pyridoxal phosphate enzyme (YggS family)